MSMEQAILELAGGMKELAVAVREAAMMNAECTKLNGEMMLAQARQFNTVGNVLTPEDEMEEAVTKVENKQALQAQEKEIGEKAKQAQEKQLADAAAKEDDKLIDADDKVLDYKADVVPPLLALEKKNKGLKALLTEFGVTKGDQLKPEQYPAIIARATALAA